MNRLSRLGWTCAGFALFLAAVSVGTLARDGLSVVGLFGLYVAVLAAIGAVCDLEHVRNAAPVRRRG